MVFDVKIEDKNKRLDLFLLEKIEGKTRSFIKNLMEVYCINRNKKTATFGCCFAEREALEPMLSRNIIKLQITDNHILSKAQSKSKSF